MTSEPLDQRFADAMGQLLGPDFPAEIGLAVSGGGDSMAMLALAHNWARVWGVTLWVVTLDHGLRDGSDAEAAMVAQEAKLLGHKHATLRWTWDGQGNLQARAREARLALIDGWRGRIGHVLFAHTADDVAETFLLRLSRQAGVEGLAEMQRSRRGHLYQTDVVSYKSPLGDLPPPADGVAPEFWLHRPCLDMSRAELRHYARTLQVPWVEDPSNEDTRFDRVKMRQLLPALDDAGLSRDALVSAARHMARAAEALRQRAAERFEVIGAEGRVGNAPTGELLFERTGFEATDRETQMRLLSYALAYVASQSYRPREASLEALLERLLAGGGGTLHGCEVRMERDRLRVFREYAAVARTRLTGSEVAAGALWDGRFHMPCGPDQTLRALGPDGWAQVTDPPENSPPFHAARSLPSLWQGDVLLACPALNMGNGTLSLWPMGKEHFSFRRFLLSH